MKYLAVDLGNVVFSMDFTKFLEKLSYELNISKGDAWAFLARAQKLHDLGYTKLRDELKDHFKIHSEVKIESIMSEWANVLIPEYSILSELKILNDDGYKIAILSNMGDEHAEFVKSILKKTGLIDKVIMHLSCDVGARKPSMIFYQSFLMQYPEFTGCVYLDDLEENLEAGKKFGFNSKKFDISGYSQGCMRDAKIKLDFVQLIKE